MSKNRQADASGVLSFLWGSFDANAASDDDLRFLSNAADEASGMAHALSHTVSGVGCLISQDQEAVGAKSGALQGGDLPNLLFGVSDALKTIAELAFIGSEAGFLLGERRAAIADAARRF